MPEKIPITAIIPVGNEIHNIEEVIDTINFCDEILVVDSFSTDGTFEKAELLADRIIQRKFDFASAQKNWAIPQAKNNWILLVDADERVTPELKNEIIELYKNEIDDHVAYWIGRTNFFMGKKVNYSGWRNDKVIRLFHKDHCKYNNKPVHEEIITNGSIGKLSNKLTHNTYTNWDDYIQKMNKYAALQAEEFNSKTGKLGIYQFILKPFWAFFKHYILQSGFRDGIVGITIGYIQAYVVFVRYVKMWKLRN